MKSSSIAVWGALGLVGSLLGGCGGSSPNKADGGGGGIGGSAGTACVEYITKYCNQVQACTPGFIPLLGFTSVADCTSYYVQGCKDALAAPHTGDTVALVEQCGDAIAATSCTAFMQRGGAPSACLPHGGTIVNGGSCYNDWQCASGRCAVQLDDVCGTCIAAVPEGQPCQEDGLGDSPCADNLVCALSSPDGGIATVCMAAAAIGDPCRDSETCPANAGCDATTSVCTQLPAIGETCDPNASPVCDPTQAAAFCDSGTLLCGPVSAAQAGQACGFVNGTYMECNGACVGDAGSGTCSPFVDEGQPCTASDFCPMGTTCTGGVCSVLVCGRDAVVTAASAPDGRRAVRPPRRPFAAAVRAGR